jgi:hypothetical protein
VRGPNASADFLSAEVTAAAHAVIAFFSGRVEWTDLHRHKPHAID